MGPIKLFLYLLYIGNCFNDDNFVLFMKKFNLLKIGRYLA